MNDPQGQRPLTAEQRRLVAQNVGLVAVHLRRHAGDPTVPTRDREWEDLFQEGCLGLIRAATAYRKDRGVPFAVFALRRIHHAVSLALHHKFSTVVTPPPRTARRRKSKRPTPRAGESEPRGRVRKRDCGTARSAPKESSFAANECARRADSRHSPIGHESAACKDNQATPAGRGRALRKPHTPEPTLAEQHDRLDTVGQRIREKYTRALRTACQTAVDPLSRRDDRKRLARILCDEHLLVPGEEYRKALREIARQTDSSFARVVQCVRLFTGTARTTLQADPEFRELHRALRVHPSSTETPIDRAFEANLAHTCAQELLRRYQRARRNDQAAILHAVFEASGHDVGSLFLSVCSRLRSAQRERLLSRTAVEAIE